MLGEEKMSNENTEINTSDIDASRIGPPIGSPGVKVVTQHPIEKIPIKTVGEESTIVPPSTEETIQAPLSKSPVNINTCDLLSDIEKSKELNMIVTESQQGVNVCPELPISTTITQTADLLKNINVIKDELCKLPLDLCEMEFINNRVNPLMNIINQLSNATANLAVSVTYLQTSSLVRPKRSELKDTIHLMYDLNEECEDVFKVLKHRINRVLKD
jgi:hypothetical protein